MSRHGFTLLDTLIALVVLELALLGAAGSIGASERLLARGRAASRAAMAGQDLLAREAIADTVCGSVTGERVLAGARVSWLPHGRPSLRQVTVVVTPSLRAPDESVATVVRCP
jgi:hypothetical protein